VDHVKLSPGPQAVESASPALNALLYTSADYFRAEMAAMATSCWQFFGITDDLADNNDWVRRRVLGTDIFVQNFKGELRGYHNVCQHRGFPLRREPKGNGIVQCGFHAWTYNKDGVPLGVARNEELFCLSREQKEALALPRVRVETVGRFVFVALSDSVPPLEAYLGRYADLFRTFSKYIRSARYRWTGPSRANWKLCYEVTLDDYHVAFVHPGSGWDVPAWGCIYEREGPHSHLLRRRTADWMFGSFWEDVARGEYEFRGHKIHQTFPNLLTAAGPRMLLMTLFSPIEAGVTEVEDIIFDLEGDEVDEPWWEETAKGHRQVSSEDRATSESQQEVIGQLARRPLFGALEARVGWFHEAYDALIGAEARRRLGLGGQVSS
jgi:phenylpropionate dioxygenase-like ring-hydroxylating dioxygenase large terminal subunit